MIATSKLVQIRRKGLRLLSLSSFIYPQNENNFRDAVFILRVRDWLVRMDTSTCHEECMRLSDGELFFEGKLGMDGNLETVVAFCFGRPTWASDVSTSALGVNLLFGNPSTGKSINQLHSCIL